MTFKSGGNIDEIECECYKKGSIKDFPGFIEFLREIS